MNINEPVGRRVLFFGLLLLFVLFQVYSVATSYITSDNALVGLAAQNILKGERPVFTYGQSFMGTIEAYLVAVLFSIFGVSSFILQTVPIFFSVLFLISLYLLVDGLLGSPTALVALGLMVFGPGYFQGYAHAARGGYIETLFFGTAFFWLVYLIVWDKNKNLHRPLKYLVLGLVAGLGFWTNILIVSYLLVGALFLILNDKKIFFKKEFLLALAGFFAGSAPFWIFNIFHPLASFGSMGQASGKLSVGILLDNSANIFFDQLPKLFNLSPAGFLKYPARLTYWFFFYIYFYFVYQRRRTLGRIFFKLDLTGSSGLEMILVLVPPVVGICIISHFGSFDVPRYVMPLLTVYPVLLAAFIGENWKKFRYLLLVPLAIIIFLNVQNIGQRLAPEVTRKNRVNESSNFVLIDFFKKNGIDAFYSDRWLSDRLVFLSRQEIIASAPGKQRQSEYGLKVNAARNPAFVFNGDSHFEAALRAAGGIYKRRELKFPTSDHYFNDYVIYYDLKAPARSYREIPPAGCEILASSDSAAAGRIFDRTIDTSWETAGLLTPGDFLLVDFRRPVHLGKVEIMPAEFSSLQHGTLGGFQILVSSDGHAWRKVAEIEDVTAPFFWSGPHPFYREENGRIALAFAPEVGRFLKIVQTKKSQRNHWAVRELFVYEPAGVWPNPRWQTEELMDYLEKIKPDVVAADYWLSSFINLATGGRIYTLKLLNETPYEEKIRIKENPRVLKIFPGMVFVIKPDEKDALEKVLSKVATGFQKRNISGWLVYSGLKLKPDAERLYFWNGTHLLSTR